MSADGRPVAIDISPAGAARSTPLAGHSGTQEPLTEVVSRLVEDTRGVVSAEVELYKAKIAERVAAYKSAAIFFGAAGVLALAALIALLVGLIMTLATLMGPGLATAVVVVAVLAVAGVLAMVGRGKMASPQAGARK